ncbi:hypothetical protein EDD15DRAFT_2202961 [Pisolithus albus]|nr:hypothetical protein EDD15DRAFT_2202961 [Pisolithus albus]
MSSQPASSSRQSTSRDLSQAPDEDLEVRTDDSEETERAKEAEKSQREVVKKERRAEVHRQRAEEVRQREEEECRRLEEERLVQEQAEQERRAREERERQAEEAARQAVVGRGKGHVEELQREGLLVQATRMGTTPLYSPTTGAQVSSMAVPIYRAACEECQQRGELSECRPAAGGRSCWACRRWKKKCSWAAEDRAALGSVSRKQAGTGGSRGEKKKRGRSGAEDEEDDEEVGADEGSEMSAPRFEAGGSRLVGERELRQRLPLDDEYHGQLLVAQEEQALVLGQQVAAMEWMASVQEAQALAIQVYVQVMQGYMWPPFPPTMVPRMGVPQGGAQSGAAVGAEREGSAMREVERSGGSEREGGGSGSDRGGSGEERGEEMDE